MTENRPGDGEAKTILQKIADSKNASDVKTNDQLRIKPPQNARTSPKLSPMGTFGAGGNGVSQDILRRNAKIVQEHEAKKADDLTPSKQGQLRVKFNRKQNF